MSLLTFVKVSNISNLSDARYCAGMGVEVLGFNIDPTSSDCIDQQDFKEITDWVAGVSFAGEFHSASILEIKSAMKNYSVDYVELSRIDLIEEVQLLGVPIIFKSYVDTQEDLKKLQSNIGYLDELVKITILKSSNPELAEKLDELIMFYNGNIKLVKGYDISPDNSYEQFPGLELEATKEEKPGLKDYGEIMDILELLDENI
jgi:phosphoribosylanthranilate isomerase